MSRRRRKTLSPPHRKRLLSVRSALPTRSSPRLPLRVSCRLLLLLSSLFPDWTIPQCSAFVAAAFAFPGYTFSSRTLSGPHFLSLALPFRSLLFLPLGRYLLCADHFQTIMNFLERLLLPPMCSYLFPSPFDSHIALPSFYGGTSRTPFKVRCTSFGFQVFSGLWFNFAAAPA